MTGGAAARRGRAVLKKIAAFVEQPHDGAFFLYKPGARAILAAFAAQRGESSRNERLNTKPSIPEPKATG